MNTRQEIHALNRVLYMLEENSVGYPADRNRSFGNTIQRIYRDMSREVSELEIAHGR